MKKRIFLVVLLVIAAAVLGVISRGGNIFGRSSGEVRREIRQTYQLDPGARVEVSGINGTVDVQTADTDTGTAEVYVLSAAGSESDLDSRPVTIDQSSSSLVVRSEQKHSWAFWRMFHSEVKQQVVLKVPRKIALSVRGVNGRVAAGEVDGSVEVHGVNGKVDVAQASDYSNISGVNGPVAISVNQLGQDGMRISGVNGGIELRLADTVNADLTASGINGKLRSDIPNVAVNDESMHSKYSAHIGTGGAPIKISGINGSIHLTRAATATSTS